MQREITRELVRRLLPGRMAESNKGSYGSVLAAAGSMAYRGAAALCTEGALRGGAGLVYLASVEPVIQLVLSRTPECCACGCRTAANGGIHPQDADALRRRMNGEALPPARKAGRGLQEIIARAEEIGTFDISTEAAPDCCTLFMPRRPETHAKLDAVHEAWELFDHEEMIERLLKQTEYIDFESNTYKAPKTLKRKHSELAPREIYQDHE